MEESKMSMTIIPKGTNDKMLVNYANVISIFTMENTTVVDTETDEEIQFVNPGKAGQSVKMLIPIKVEKGWILRRKK